MAGEICCKKDTVFNLYREMDDGFLRKNCVVRFFVIFMPFVDPAYSYK